MEAERVTLQVVYDGGPTRMLFGGELDLVSAEWFASAIAGELDAAPHVIVDLSRARMGDSSPFAALLRARVHAARMGRQVEVRPELPLLEALATRRLV